MIPSVFEAWCLEARPIWGHCEGVRMAPVRGERLSFHSALCLAAFHLVAQCRCEDMRSLKTGGVLLRSVGEYDARTCSGASGYEEK